jgi:nicotinate-nucleotide pyrophosphorylase (carboxylating)
MYDVLNDSRISRLVELALMEDIGLGDLTSEAIIPDDRLGEAEFCSKADGVIAGLEVAALTMHLCDSSLTIDPEVHEGARVRHGQVVARVRGLTRGILKGERTALNFLQRMSGIATLTSRYVETVSGTGAKITDTRKTAPGLRVLDKRAVALGGGVNHRFGLDDMVLIKDNHVAAAGGIGPAVTQCVEYLRTNGIRADIEVETKNLAEVREAMDCGGFARIMLDNFTAEAMREAVQMVNHQYETEASGGITLETVRMYAETGVDFISVGALTHSVQALDISLELLPALPGGPSRV